MWCHVKCISDKGECLLILSMWKVTPVSILEPEVSYTELDVSWLPSAMTSGKRLKIRQNGFFPHS